METGPVQTTTVKTSTEYKYYVVWGRLLTFLLGCIAMTLGLYAHYNSYWNSYTDNQGHTYDVCGSKEFQNKYLTCPNISLEFYFIFAVITCFAFTGAGLALSFWTDMSRFRLVDAAFHAISAILLIVAGIVFMVSANQIKMVIEAILPDYLDEEKFYTNEKLAAGGITTINGLIYVVLAYFLFIRKLL